MNNPAPTSAELLPCPMCGSDQIGGVHDHVYCDACGLTITKPRPLENAIAAWNRRAAMQTAEPVAFAVTAQRGGIHKLSITRDSAERKAARWREEWPDNGCQVRPLIFGDAPDRAPSIDMSISAPKIDTSGERVDSVEVTSIDSAADAGRYRDLLAAVVREIPHRNPTRNGDAPGHSHRKPGIWDDFNGPKSGTPCAWCLVWKEANQAIAALQPKES
jgi:hypothetical protein